MSLIAHAKKEFEIAGWPGDDEMQKMMCDCLLELLETFSKQGHSGFSAPYCLEHFDKLARFQTISPLTGEDDEWVDVGDGMFQNKRDSTVFKENGEAYWLDGKIFRDKDGCTYTNSDSRVPVTFPWVRPESEIVDVDE
ncbi:hypothetical protein GZ77_15775 [Endozoicomonas montiporae]|uniref:Uncharacterized protein n=2 Tax=Endozoicomonas montiporae TaxID=1027273 RepID=A0A081N5M7_9GAMM|nr:hypothetical protein [Endozoicomonas montiporae]AMO57353.1 hypothetical protein EZMO1_3361 [Endozoicomonas montiporae CL-33]KEQ13750.1 hypothetical protein GZ77_15775 [Endozoicomonas montiporae]